MPSNFAQAPVIANHFTGNPSKLQITWQNDPIGRLARSKDKLMMIILAEGKYTVLIITRAVRDQESRLSILPAEFENDEGGYLFFG